MEHDTKEEENRYGRNENGGFRFLAFALSCFTKKNLNVNPTGKTDKGRNYNQASRFKM